MFRRFLLVCMVCLLAFQASVSFAAAEAGDATSIKHFRMGGSALGLRGTSKQDAEATFNVYLTALYQQVKTDLSLYVAMYPNSSALLAAFDKGEIDGFFGTPLDYLSRKNRAGKYLVGVEFKLGPLKQRFYIVARADDGTAQLKDLEHKRLTLGAYMDIEELYLNTVLLRSKLPEIPVFFRERREAKSPNIALMDVFFNNSDVTVVRENEYNIAVELNPQLSKKLIVLGKSEPYLATVGFLSDKFPDEDFKGLVDAFQKVANSEMGKKLMDIVQVSGVAMVALDDVKNVQELVTENALLRRAAGRATKSITTEKIKTRRDAR